MAPKKLPLTCLILCGGKSHRMGRPKAFLPYNGTTMIEHILQTAGEVFDEVLLVANDPEIFSDFGVDVVKDILPYRGPLGGVLSGLLVAANHHAFVLPCDVPFVASDLLKAMAASRKNSDVLVLSHHSQLEPLIAIYSKNCITLLEEALFAGRPNVHDFVSGLNADTFDYDLLELQKLHGLPSYFNVDTPQDYNLAIAGASQV
jgi:molybdopterin-guanine dinucleotide biosynthesis protein A